MWDEPNPWARVPPQDGVAAVSARSGARPARARCKLAHAGLSGAPRPRAPLRQGSHTPSRCEIAALKARGAVTINRAAGRGRGTKKPRAGEGGCLRSGRPETVPVNEI